MKIDFTADAPFSIKEDIDDLYNRYIYITHSYSGYLIIAIVIIVLLYFFCSTHHVAADPYSSEELRKANEERMKQVRRRQVGDVCFRLCLPTNSPWKTEFVNVSKIHICVTLYKSNIVFENKQHLLNEANQIVLSFIPQGSTLLLQHSSKHSKVVVELFFVMQVYM